jgi:hypothetical protein
MPLPDDTYQAIVLRVRRRGLIIVAAAAAILVVVAARGATLYAALLPGEIPVRGEIGHVVVWPTSAPLHWVNAEPATIYGQLIQGMLMLVVAAALLRTGLLERIWAALRRFLLGPVSARLSALEACVVNYLLAGLAASMTVLGALDSWEMWSLALGHQAPAVHMAFNAVGILILVAIVPSVTLVWREWKTATADN